MLRRATAAYAQHVQKLNMLKICLRRQGFRWNSQIAVRYRILVKLADSSSFLKENNEKTKHHVEKHALK